jgi:hypothetical protein
MIEILNIIYYSISNPTPSDIADVAIKPLFALVQATDTGPYSYAVYQSLVLLCSTAA